jgi:AraC-like DNA-binding protein
MISLDTLLDGLEVTLTTPQASAPGRATLHCSPEWLIVTTPRMATGRGAGPSAVAFHFRAVCLGATGLFDELREPLTTAVEGNGSLGECAEALRDESCGEAPGTRAMVEALVRRCLILVLRSWVDGGLALHSLPSLGDPGLARAVAAMRAKPASAFTLASLAEVAGMSRSVFAERFVAGLEVPPMEYLASLRLDGAARLLAGSELPVKAIAARVGYRSRTSFTRAFALRHGVGPSRFRAAAANPRSTDGMARSPGRPVPPQATSF